MPMFTKMDITNMMGMLRRILNQNSCGVNTLQHMINAHR